MSDRATTKSPQQQHASDEPAREPPRREVAGPASGIMALQRAAGNQAVSGHVQQVLRSSGQPLDSATQNHMEQAFQQDFSQVRLHADHQAAESATAVRAKAYTVGQDVVFGAGQYAPETSTGKQLLAHELAHVVQQSRGGAPAPSIHSSRPGGSPLEAAADHAAAQAVTGSGPVTVAGAAAPSVMREPDNEEENKAARRVKEKQKTQQRKQERATAGKQESQISRAQAERDLRALEDSYRQPGATQRALKYKEQDLVRYKKLLKRAGGTQLEKNKRQGAFDELQRTPKNTLGKPQTKHVAGGAQLPGQDLRPGRDAYAQPDYSIVRRRKDGSFERVHVNLKSDQIQTQTPAKARATARTYVNQAIRNSRHLAQGESIIISFAHTPSKEVQEEMKREFFQKGSPVGEVRFGTTTHKRENYKPLAQPPAQPKAKTPAKLNVKKQPKKTAVKTTKTTLTKANKSRISKIQPAKQKVTTPKVTAPKVITPKVTTPKVTTPKITAPKVITPKVTTPKVTTPKITTPRVSTPRVTSPKGLTGTAPRTLVRSGMSRGSMSRGGGGGAGAAMGAALIEAIAVPIINHYMRKHFADKIETEARELIAKAIEDKRPEFEKLIEARHAEIQQIQAEGREVMLRVAVDTSWQDTDIGTVLMNPKVGDYQLVFEDGPSPKPYKRSKPGGWFGDFVRGQTGTELTFETFDIALEGTDPQAKARRQARKLIDAKMSAPAGSPPVPFEYFIIHALENNLPLDDLSDYTAYRFEQATKAFDAGVPAQAAGLSYWASMQALMDGTLDQLITAAKAKNIRLDTLRAVAVQRRDLAGQSSDAGAGPAAAAYWSEVVRLIDAK